MNTGAIYAVTAFVCMLQILLILNRTQMTEYRETVDVPFCNMLCFFVVFCLLDAVWGLFDAGLFGARPIGFLIVSYVYHFAASLSGNVGFGYGLSYVQADEKDRKTLNFCRAGIFVLQVILLIVNLVNHEAFWVDGQGRYYTGGMRISLYSMQLVYYVMLMIYAGYKWHAEAENKRLYRNAFFFAFIPWLFGIGQYLFYDVAMYSLGFTFAIFVLYTYKVTARREAFMEERLSSLDRMQTSIIHGLAGNFVSIYYVDLETEEFEIYKNSKVGNCLIKEEGKHRDFFETVVEQGKQTVLPEDQKKFLRCFTRRAIGEALERKNRYKFTVRLSVGGEPRFFQYRFLYPASEEEKNKLIVGVYDVDEDTRIEQARQEQIRLIAEREALLKEEIYVDVMTGLNNRRAYEDTIHRYETGRIERNFIYLSIDVNSLKAVNDTLGHEAGDELLRGAALCMQTCLGPHGRIFRTGGDEFVAMLYTDRDKLYEILTDFDRAVLNWSGKLVKELTVSYGFVIRAENDALTISEIAKLADKRMYQDKEDYYANRGIDRRSQQEAYDAVRNSYMKILKINLTTERFSLIRVNDVSDREKLRERRPDESVADLLQDFELFGSVHRSDLAGYRKNTDIEFLRDYFRQGNKILAVYYRRKIGRTYKRVMMEIIPAREYTNEEQIVFLYEKNIDR